LSCAQQNRNGRSESARSVAYLTFLGRSGMPARRKSAASAWGDRKIQHSGTFGGCYTDVPPGAGLSAGLTIRHRQLRSGTMSDAKRACRLFPQFPTDPHINEPRFMLSGTILNRGAGVVRHHDLLQLIAWIKHKHRACGESKSSSAARWIARRFDSAGADIDIGLKATAISERYAS